jgi:tetratricopeptide (TPR) repeat protein
MSDHRTTPACLGERQVASLREGLQAEIAMHPSWPDLWNLRGLLNAYEGEFPAALADFQEAMRLNPSYWRAHWNGCWAGLLASPTHSLPIEPPEASRTLQPPQLLQMIRDLKQSRLPGPERRAENPALGFALLALHAAHGRSEEFESTLEVLRSMDRKIDDLFRVAGLTNSDGIDESRVAELGRPELMNPGLCDLLNRTGRMESLTGNAEEALRLFALAALLEGNRAAYLLERAEILNRQRKPEAVLPLLKEAVETRPDWFRAHMALGYELSVRGILEEALHHLEKAVSLQPDYPDVQYQFGLLLHGAGRDAEAIQTMERALHRNPQYLVARIALANLLFEERREAEAAPHYARVFEEGIETPSLAGRFGYSLHAAGSRNHAEELFLEAISQDQERPDLLCLYGMFLSETDRRFEARTVWTRALRCEPSAETRVRIQALLAHTQEDEEVE